MMLYYRCDRLRRFGSVLYLCFFFYFQAEDGIRDLVRSRGLGDVYKRQVLIYFYKKEYIIITAVDSWKTSLFLTIQNYKFYDCLLYTSDAADERSSVDLGGRRIIKKKNNVNHHGQRSIIQQETSQQQSTITRIKTQKKKR